MTRDEAELTDPDATWYDLTVRDEPDPDELRELWLDERYSA